MAKIYGVGLLVVVAVSTLYPFVFLSQRDQLHLKGWYNSFGPFSQLILYACARVASYPYLVDLQHAVSNSLNTVAACMVVALGELAGGTMQGFLFDTVLAPLSQVRGSKESLTFTSASRRNPMLFCILAHMSFFQVLTPYAIAFGVYCFGDSEDLLQAVVGSALGEVLMFIPVNLASPDSSSVWAYQFAYEIAIPSLRTCATILLAYRLWCEHQAVSNGLGMPAKTTDYQKFSISFQNEAGDEDHASPPLTRSRAHQRSRSRGRLAAAAAPVSTPSQLLRFKEGPPKVLTKAANMLTPPMLRRKPEQAEAQTAPARRGPSRPRRTAPSSSPVRGARRASADGRSAPAAAAKARAAAEERAAEASRHKDTVATKTIEHRLETTLTEAVYRTPRRSSRLSTRKQPE